MKILMIGVLVAMFVLALPWTLKLVRLWWDKLQENAPPKMVGRVRAAVGVIGGAGLAFPHQAAEYLSWPEIESPLKFIALGCLALAFLLRAGDKTPPEVREMAAAESRRRTGDTIP